MFGVFVSSYRMNAAQKIIALAMGMLLSLLGCGAKAPIGYLKPGVTASQISSLAVLPFDNTSGHPDAGKKVVNLLLTELARTELFEIAEVGEVEKSLRSMRIRTTAEIDLSKLRNLGKQLNVQAIIVGSVDEYETRQERNGTVPVVAISARMLEVQTGDILWAISHTHDGNDWETIFGFGKIISLSQLAQIVVSEMVESLVQGLMIPLLRIAKLGPETALSGAEIGYSIEVQNVGAINATGVVITDTIPVEGMSFIRASEGGVPSGAVGTVKWNLGNLAINQRKTVSITLKAIQGGEWTNRVQVDCNEGAPAFSSFKTTVLKPSLTLEKKATPASILLGKTTTFDITVSNMGNTQVTKVVILDRLPPGLRYKDSTENGAPDKTGNIRWQFDTLQPDETKMFTLTATGIRAGQHTNEATASNAEGATATDNAIVTVLALPAMRMTMVDSKEPISAGGRITYTIAVENKGAGVATDVLVVDNAPQEMSIIQATTSAGSYNIRENTIVFNIGTVQPGGKVTLSIKVKALEAGDVVNTAELTLHEFDSPIIVGESTAIIDK